MEYIYTVRRWVKIEESTEEQKPDLQKFVPFVTFSAISSRKCPLQRNRSTERLGLAYDTSKSPFAGRALVKRTSTSLGPQILILNFIPHA